MDLLMFAVPNLIETMVALQQNWFELFRCVLPFATLYGEVKRYETNHFREPNVHTLFANHSFPICSLVSSDDTMSIVQVVLGQFHLRSKLKQIVSCSLYCFERTPSFPEMPPLNLLPVVQRLLLPSPVPSDGIIFRVRFANTTEPVQYLP